MSNKAPYPGLSLSKTCVCPQRGGLLENTTGMWAGKLAEFSNLVSAGYIYQKITKLPHHWSDVITILIDSTTTTLSLAYKTKVLFQLA